MVHYCKRRKTYMKRIIALVIAAIMSVSVLAGCGGGSDLNKVMSDINSTYSLNLKTLESKDDLSKYYSIKPESVKQFAAEIDSNNNAPVEIIMVEATDADAAAKFINGVIPADMAKQVAEAQAKGELPAARETVN